jgi:DNA mismatch repair protein MutS
VSRVGAGGFPGDGRRLAGLPLAVIDRAKTILAKLESDEPSVTLPAQGPIARPRKKIAVSDADDDQLSLL